MRKKKLLEAAADRVNAMLGDAGAIEQFRTKMGTVEAGRFSDENGETIVWRHPNGDTHTTTRHPDGSVTMSMDPEVCARLVRKMKGN